jgi:hypothetical protein
VVSAAASNPTRRGNTYGIQRFSHNEERGKLTEKVSLSMCFRVSNAINTRKFRVSEGTVSDNHW